MPTTREIRKICYHVNRVGYSVPDAIWCDVIPEEYHDNVVCLECFTRLADEMLIAWDREIAFWPVSLATSLNQSFSEVTQVNGVSL